MTDNLKSLKRKLASAALAKAANVRIAAGVALTESFCVFDFVEENQITDVLFVDIPSLEEIYWKDGKKILISSHRPVGRQAFSCGHGFGHHIFGHGVCVAEFLDVNGAQTTFEPNEYLVNCFAGFLLMPKTTVCYGFSSRGWKINECNPYQLFSLAGWLGVGYSTLIKHMCFGLKLIPSFRIGQLLKVKPSQIRREILPNDYFDNVAVVDYKWNGRPVDIAVGDAILTPKGTRFMGKCIKLHSTNMNGDVLIGVEPGCDGKLWDENSSWYIPVRVSRKNYVGRNIFRYDEDPDYVRTMVNAV